MALKQRLQKEALRDDAFRMLKQQPLLATIMMR